MTKPHIAAIEAALPTAYRGARRPSLMWIGSVLFLGSYIAPAHADIWGYVDANRMPHFAPTQLDERYELLLKDSDAPEPFRRIDGKGQSASSSASASKGRTEDLLARDSQPAVLSIAPDLPPKIATFFERSVHYKAVSPLLQEASKTHGVDYSLLKAVIITESGFNPYAVSPKGAVGLMQVIPPTAERYGVTAQKGSTVAARLTDPKTNIRAGTRYLSDLIRMFPGRLELALAAYNAGEGAVQRAGNAIPNYPETRNYVKTVMNLYTSLSGPQSKPLTGQVRPETRQTPMMSRAPEILVNAPRFAGTPGVASAGSGLQHP